MKIIGTCILISALMCGAAPAQDVAKGLQVVRSMVVSDQDSTTPDDLRVLLWVKNIGEKDVTVLTRGLQLTLFNHTDKPKELSINLSSQMNIDGAPVIPSLSDLSPVTLKTGEIALIKVPYRDRNNLKTVVLIYDMRDDLSKRFLAWDGIVRSGEVEVMKAKGNR